MEAKTESPKSSERAYYQLAVDHSVKPGRYRPKPYEFPSKSTPKSASNDKENIPDPKKCGWLTSRRLYTNPPGFYDVEPNPDVDEGESAKPPVKNYPGDKVLIGRKDTIYQNSVDLKKDKRYCCKDCHKWYSRNDNVYVSMEVHLQRSCRHKQPPRPPTPPGLWKIGFSDSDSD